MNLKGYNAIITGANQGLGLAIAEEFLKQGASISICARDDEKLKTAEEYLKTKISGEQKIFSKKADVSIENDVKEFVVFSEKNLGRIDILVNNAGMYGPKGAVENINSDEWIKTLEINLFGVFFMCKNILAHMKKNKYGKIINLSGGGATSPLPNISAYAASKAAVVRFTETLAKECKDLNIDINAMAPGALNTKMLDEILDAGPNIVGKEYYDKAVKQKENGGAPVEKAAQLCCFLASKESDGISGRLISAVWDPWQNLSQLKEDLKNTDIYTLRRIIPEDRSLNWGVK